MLFYGFNILNLKGWQDTQVEMPGKKLDVQIWSLMEKSSEIQIWDLTTHL